MKRKMLTVCIGIMTAGVIALPLSAGDAKDAAKQPAAGGAPAMSPEIAAAMARMEAYGALNENHGYLKQFEGEWVCKTKWWMAADAPAMENTFASTAKIAFDGHFLIEKVTGNMSMGEGMPEQPFSGMSIVGYDNHKKQFFSTWMDNMMSGMMTEYGSASQGGKVFTFEGENYCCMTDKVAKSKSIVTIIDANTRKLEMWGPGLDGKVYKAMEISYTRKK